MMMNISSGAKARFSNVSKQFQRIEQPDKTQHMSGLTVTLPSVCDADTVIKPSIQFGNDYANRRNAALDEKKRQQEAVQQAADLLKARQEAEALEIEFQQLLPLLNSPVLEAVGEVPAFTQGDLLCLLSKPAHKALQQRTDCAPESRIGQDFYFTQSFLSQEGFNEQDAKTLSSATREMVSKGLLMEETGLVEGQYQQDYTVLRGFSVTKLGHHIANRYAEEKANPQS